MSGDLSYIENMAALHARLVRVGVQTEQDRLYPLLAKIYAAYEAAIEQGQPVPTLVMAAIVGAKNSTGPIATRIPREPSSYYYNQSRNGDGDIGPGGTRLKPGS